MLGKTGSQNQKNMFQLLLKEFINMEHELVLLADNIQWKKMEEEFAPLYSKTGTPSKPIRLMAGLLILKQLYDLGDETIMEAYVRDPYMQYFCGEAHFRWDFPCDPSDLVHFRKRIGEKGIEFIFKQSVLLFGKKAQEEEICVDTTAQEKNITFPTDTKLQIKIIKKCNKIAKAEGIEQRQTYTRKTKELLLQSRFSSHPKRKKQAKKAQRKIKTIATRLVTELERKLSSSSIEKYSDELTQFKRVLNQKRGDSNKIYSLHEPDVACIAKGKASKPYEFGSKVSIARTKNSGIIVGVKSFKGNPHDSQSIESTLDQHEIVTGIRAKTAIVDRGYPKKMINGTQILKPENGKAATAYEKRKNRKRFRRRAAIEPTISHLKHQYRMGRNYLKGIIGDQINAMMAATAWNFKKWMREMSHSFLCLIFLLLKIELQNQYNNRKASC